MWDEFGKVIEQDFHLASSKFWQTIRWVRKRSQGFPQAVGQTADIDWGYSLMVEEPEDLGEVAKVVEKLCSGKNRICWRNYMSNLALECLWIPQEKLESVVGEKASGMSCLACCHHHLIPDKQKIMNAWMDLT